MAAPTVLILASGRGERFLASGGTTHKLDAPFKGKTVLQTTVDAVITSGLPYHIERQVHAGMGDAISAAVAKTADANGWLILPADMPLIGPIALQAVALALAENPNHIALPFVDGKRGHPVGFPKQALMDLLTLAGDVGAQSVLQKFKTKKINVNEIAQVARPQGCLIDIDTLEDLQRARLFY